MANEDLVNLEGRIDALITAVQQLKSENHSLASEKDKLKNEYDQLLEKTKLARQRIESMIDRLKAIERSS